jgi:hypothetical protein
VITAGVARGRSRLRWGWPLVAAAVLQGCPVYDDYCNNRSDCAPGFECNVYSGNCELVTNEPGLSCVSPSGCGPGETCGQAGECRTGSCVFHGCVSGYTCSVVDGIHTCAPQPSNGDGGPGATEDGGVPPPTGTTPDASIAEPPDAGVTADAAIPTSDAGAVAPAPADAAVADGAVDSGI